MEKSEKPAVPCTPITLTLSVLGGKWKPVIIYHLSRQTLRFNKLYRHIPGITQKMLAQQLREMEDAGLVRRKIYPVVPPKVEYSLTEYGRTLDPLLTSMYDWGKKHKVRIQASQQE